MWRQLWSSIFVVFKTIKVSFAFQRQSSPLAYGDNHSHPPLHFRRRQCLHLHFEDDNGFRKATMPSFTFRRRQCLHKGDNAFIYILKITMSSKGNNAFIYISKMTMSSKGDNALIYISKTTMSSQRRQCLHLHFKDDNVFNHFTLSKDDNAFIYISKMTMSSIISCFQRRQCLHLRFRR